MPDDISIDGVKYPLLHTDKQPGWEVVQQGEIIRHEWNGGFIRGMGSDYYVANGFDLSSYPYARLRPRWEATTTLSGAIIQISTPIYTFRARSTSGAPEADYLYILNANNIYKVLLSTTDSGGGTQFTIRSTLSTFSGTIGRPALFEGTWYIPFGDSGSNVQKLTTIVSGPGADTYTTTTYTARHLAVMQNTAAAAPKPASLVRAHTTNLVDMASDGATFGDDFEVGDTSLGINDLISGQGEVWPTKPDSIWRFDDKGNALPVQSFIGRYLNLPAVAGAHGMAHGPYTYWPHVSGLWRVVGNQARPIDPQSELTFTSETLDSFTPFSTGGTYRFWTSVAAWGRWLYAAHGRQVYYGYIQEDGTVTWHGAMFQGSGSGNTGAVVSVIDGPYLLIFEEGSGSTPQLKIVQLANDGSLRSQLDDSTYGRGNASETYRFWLPEVDGGQRWMKYNKHWRSIWALFEGTLSSESPFQLGAHFDGADTSTSAGSTITASGFAERDFGVTQRARRARPTVNITTGSAYGTTLDPRIRAMGITAVAPYVYRARLDLQSTSTGGLRGKRPAEALQLLHDLVGQALVTVIPPGDNTGFSGYVTNVAEQLQGEEQGRGVGYIVDVLIERMDWV